MKSGKSGLKMFRLTFVGSEFLFKANEKKQRAEGCYLTTQVYLSGPV
jgi:hypothetical protein